MTGKEKCELLKMMRVKIAKENGIQGFEYEKCPYEGPCKGTCPACDAETNALYEILKNQGKEVEANDVKELKSFFNDMETMGLLDPEWPSEPEIKDSVIEDIKDKEKRMYLGEIKPTRSNRPIEQEFPEDMLEGKIVRPIRTLGSIKAPDEYTSHHNKVLRGKIVKIDLKDKDRIKDNAHKQPRGLLGRFKKKNDKK